MLSCVLSLRVIACRSRACARLYGLVHSTRWELAAATQPHSFGHGARAKICSQSERLPNQVVAGTDPEMPACCGGRFGGIRGSATLPRSIGINSLTELFESWWAPIFRCDVAGVASRQPWILPQRWSRARKTDV